MCLNVKHWFHMTPSHTFRIKPDKTSGLYFTVKIFPTLQGMRAYARKNREAKLGQFYGLSTSWRKWKLTHRKTGDTKERWLGSRELGEILLAEKYLSARIVSHECTHAALGWARRKKLDLADEGDSGKVSNIEEALCHAQGNFVKQVYDYAYKHKII